MRLDEDPDANGVRLESVGELFEGLLDAAVGRVNDAHLQRVESLTAALRSATFALPDGVDDLRVHVLGLGRGGSSPVVSPLPSDAERSLVISPFLSDGFFTAVHLHPINELVSREESLDSLKPGTLADIGSTYVFDDGSATDLAAVADDSRLSLHDPGRPLVGLHAKAFAFEEGDSARLFVGSANATRAAFERNVEILVELIGSKTVLGIDRLCDGNDDEPGLRAWFVPYLRPGGKLAEAEDTSALDAARMQIARLAIEGTVEADGSEWAVTYRSRESLPNLPRTTIHCWPLASPGSRCLVDGGRPFMERFETSLEALSGFLAFELAQIDGTKTEFVVPVPLTGVPGHRDRILLRALVGNAERFLRYVLALLEEDSPQLEFLDAVELAAAGASGNGLGPAGLPVLERLLKTMRRDPAKLKGLDPLVKDLAAEDDLPEGFADLWEAIFDVASVRREGRASVP